METIKYIGIFFNQTDILKCAQKQIATRLTRVIDHPHVTFAYKPTEIPWEVMGEAVTVQVVGYGRNKRNEAFEVRFGALSPQQEALANQIKSPHITISVAENAKPVDSGKLDFAPIESFFLTGVFGYMTTDDVVGFAKTAAEV